MTKRIRRLTAALLAAALLAGCGGSDSGSNTASYDAVAEESQALASGGTESALLPRHRHRRKRAEDHLPRRPVYGIDRL